MVSLVTLQKRGFEELATICARLSLTRLLVVPGSKCLVMFKFDQLYMATTCRGRFFFSSIFGTFFLQKHIENQRTKTLNDKFNPLNLSQLKKNLDPGLI